MQKRFFLFLALAFLILLTWRPGGGPSRPSDAAAVPDEVPPPAEVRAGDEVPAEPMEEAEPWRETLLLGRPGERGRYRATFDNAGARLIELHDDGSVESSVLWA